MVRLQGGCRVSVGLCSWHRAVASSPLLVCSFGAQRQMGTSCGRAGVWDNLDLVCKRWAAAQRSSHRGQRGCGPRPPRCLAPAERALWGQRQMVGGHWDQTGDYGVYWSCEVRCVCGKLQKGGGCWIFFAVETLTSKRPFSFVLHTA